MRVKRPSGEGMAALRGVSSGGLSGFGIAVGIRRLGARIVCEPFSGPEHVLSPKARL